jgi:hypothetical protein
MAEGMTNLMTRLNAQANGLGNNRNDEQRAP